MTIKKNMEIAQDYCWENFKVSSNQHVALDSQP